MCSPCWLHVAEFYIKKKIVRERYVSAGPLPSALPPPPRPPGHFGRWVIVCRGLHGHVALHHCAAWFAWLFVLWVIVGHSFCIAHVGSWHSKFDVSLWVIVHDSQLVVVYFMRPNSYELNITYKKFNR